MDLLFGFLQESGFLLGPSLSMRLPSTFIAARWRETSASWKLLLNGFHEPARLSISIYTQCMYVYVCRKLYAYAHVGAHVPVDIDVHVDADVDVDVGAYLCV